MGQELAARIPLAGGELGQNLKSLYDYCERQLMLANARNEPALIDEVLGLCEQLRDAWQQIGEQVPAAALAVGK